jgi:hypothetical protein
MITGKTEILEKNEREAMVKSLLIMCFIILSILFFSCTSPHRITSLNKLSKEEIEAYNNDPSNTDKIVCIKESPVGTRIPKKICRMQSTIDERTKKDQQSIQQIQTKGVQGTRKGGG